MHIKHFITRNFISFINIFEPKLLFYIFSQLIPQYHVLKQFFWNVFVCNIASWMLWNILSLLFHCCLHVFLECFSFSGWKFWLWTFSWWKVYSILLLNQLFKKITNVLTILYWTNSGEANGVLQIPGFVLVFFWVAIKIYF